MWTSQNYAHVFLFRITHSIKTWFQRQTPLKAKTSQRDRHKSALISDTEMAPGSDKVITFIPSSTD
jgi:hypothetical protein